MSIFDTAHDQAIFEQLFPPKPMVNSKRSYMVKADLRVVETTHKDHPTLVDVYHHGSYVETPIGSFHTRKRVSCRDIFRAIDLEMLSYLRHSDRSYKLLSDLILALGVPRTIDLLKEAGLTNQRPVHPDFYASLHEYNYHSVITKVAGVDIFVHPEYCAIKTGDDSYVALIPGSCLPETNKLICDAASKALHLQ